MKKYALGLTVSCLLLLVANSAIAGHRHGRSYAPVDRAYGINRPYNFYSSLYGGYTGFSAYHGPNQSYYGGFYANRFGPALSGRNRFGLYLGY